jgi:hypothetical protein
MSTSDRPISDERLIEYLLGASGDETELLDERGIADDAIASRLTALENDLVDAYVRGELPEATRERFRAHYLASEHRREKVRFAEALARFDVRPRATSSSTRETSGKPLARRAERLWPAWLPGFMPQWSAAALAVVLVAVVGYVLWDTVPTGERIPQAGGGEPVTSAEVERPATIALLLLPDTRAGERIASLDVPAGTAQVTLRLKLEFDDFPTYAATIRDPADDRAVWSVNEAQSEAGEGGTTVSITLPASALMQRNYVVELSGIPPQGPPELVASYPFRVLFL